MKSMQDEKGDLLGTTTISFGPGNHKIFDDLKERVTTDVLLSAGFVAVVALYVVMLFGLSTIGVNTRPHFRQKPGRQ
jgi:hypothetical protein